ncbi:hypothetical protein AC578_6815 [Pseudocercospora eumusae]|uniref:Uncharacterized protein n=1 Tax=Pseudocercospora eumusae TaxID=321146 RepID=A0A139H4S0_9PEZI|nr:hypothetical protein AC578_6815 [Pseudocercospora eumusae]
MRLLCAVFCHRTRATACKSEIDDKTALLVLESVLQFVDLARCSRHESVWSGVEVGGQGEQPLLLRIICNIFKTAAKTLADYTQASSPSEEEAWSDAVEVFLNHHRARLDRTLEASDFCSMWMTSFSREFLSFLAQAPPPSGLRNQADAKEDLSTFFDFERYESTGHQ